MMRDWYVDGHFISASNKSEAEEWCKYLYGHSADVIRPWTDEGVAA